MTYAELQDAAWHDAPPIRKRVIGRQTFNELVAVTVRNWSPNSVAACSDDRLLHQYARKLLEQVRAGHQEMTGQTQQEYGFIWVFLLCAVASAVIQWLIKRWLDNHFSEADLQAWQGEMAL